MRRGDDAVYGEARGSARARSVSVPTGRALSIGDETNGRERRRRASERERASERPGPEDDARDRARVVTPRTRGVRAMTTMGASGRERIVGARRRANRARWVRTGSGPRDRSYDPMGRPARSYNGPTVWRLMQEELIERVGTDNADEREGDGRGGRMDARGRATGERL